MVALLGTTIRPTNLAVISNPPTTAPAILSNGSEGLGSDLAFMTSGGHNMVSTVGNAVTYDVVLELMENGVSGVLIGVGPGAACTSRGVLGLGVPQVTATVDSAAARDAYDLARFIASFPASAPPSMLWKRPHAAMRAEV